MGGFGSEYHDSVTLAGAANLGGFPLNNVLQLFNFEGLETLKPDREGTLIAVFVNSKPALEQIAHAAVKDNSNPYYKLKYEKIAKRRGKKRAIIAIARMILTAINSMFCTGEVWNPVDLFKIDMPEHLKEQQLAKAIKQATRFLEQGVSVA